MLQIITGKFYKSAQCHETLHRTIYYTNYRTLARAERLETKVGVLFPTTGLDGLAAMSCEVLERIENPDGKIRSGTVTSTGGAQILNDFAAVTAFALNITCTPDPDLTRRLLNTERPNLGVDAVPSRFIKRTFDRQIISQDDDANRLAKFVDQLVSLKRKRYEAAIRSIRQYVTGLHRMADSLSLSYALLVMSIESLAQDFDGEPAQWSDFDPRKKKKIDTALSDASDEVAEKVRNALLEIEHVALSRRFRDFALAHLGPEFFREEADAVTYPISRADIPLALQKAYNIRSSYVHTQRDLPKILNVPEMPEMIEVEDRPALSIAGIARLARHAITQYIFRAETIETEEFNYKESLPNIVTMRAASQYWIWNPEGFTYQNGPERLTAFIEQIVSTFFLRIKDAKISDMRKVLEKIEKITPSLELEHRLSLMTLYFLWHQFLPPEHHCDDWSTVFDKYKSDFDAPSIESFVAHILTEQEPGWTLEQFENLHQRYFKSRHKNRTTKIGRTLEAAFSLSVAEKNRQAGKEERSRQLVSFSVELNPKIQSLRAFEAGLPNHGLPEILWKEILLPPNKINGEQ